MVPPQSREKVAKILREVLREIVAFADVVEAVADQNVIDAGQRFDVAVVAARGE